MLLNCLILLYLCFLAFLLCLFGVVLQIFKQSINNDFILASFHEKECESRDDIIIEFLHTDTISFLILGIGKISGSLQQKLGMFILDFFLFIAESSLQENISQEHRIYRFLDKPIASFIILVNQLYEEVR